MLVTAYSMTNGGHVALESGLEHDLVRWLDRDPNVLRIVAQPAELSWNSPTLAHHFPDLLTLHGDGGVTMWDVRAEEEQDEEFQTKSAITREACMSVGWRYQVFSGLAEQERLNLLWLHGFRRRLPWADRFEDQIRTATHAHGVTLGALLSADDGTGELTSVVWHLLWRNDVLIPMDTRWTPDTPVSIGAENT